MKKTSKPDFNIIFVAIQVLQDKETNKTAIDLPYLLNNNGFPLEHLLSKRTLPNHLSRIFNGIGIKSDEDMMAVLTRMQTMKLVERYQIMALGDSGGVSLDWNNLLGHMPKIQEVKKNDCVG